jgi:hypothetical protein
MERGAARREGIQSEDGSRTRKRKLQNASEEGRPPRECWVEDWLVRRGVGGKSIDAEFVLEKIEL